MAEASESDHIWQLVRTINQAWLQGKAERMAEVLHPAAVFVHANFAGRVEGREACVKSYADFSSQSKVHHFQEFDPHVDVTGDTAVATYRFQIKYDMGGKTFDEAGQDVLIFNRQDGRWQVVWRAIVPLPTSEKEA